MHTRAMQTEATVLADQWSDFLLRRVDPYAMAKYKILLDWMGDIQGKSVLVAGCGSGEFCAFLALRGAAVDAFDIEQENLDLAQETAKRLKTTFHTFVGTIEDTKTDKQYDFVAATDVIEHIEDDRAAMSKLKSFVKPGGHLVITVPAREDLMGYHDEILGHYRRYSSKTIKALVEPDFKLIHIRYFGFFLIPVTYVLSCLLRRPYPVAVIGQIKESKGPVGTLLSFFFSLESKVRLGMGTSLLLVAKNSQTP